MTWGSMVSISSVFLGAQLLLVILAVLWEQLWAMLGMEYSPVSGVSTDSWSMFLYVGLGAPIAEEILFRGLVLRSLQPCGKKFAILASALLFGFFHGSFLQGLFACMVGVILGYVAMEFNILWAMVLHMLNNLILSDALPRIGKLLGVGDMLTWLAVLLAAVIGVVVLIVRRKRIGAYLWNKQNDPLCWQAFFTAPGILIFLALMAFSAALLEKQAIN